MRVSRYIFVAKSDKKKSYMDTRTNLSQSGFRTIFFVRRTRTLQLHNVFTISLQRVRDAYLWIVRILWVCRIITERVRRFEREPRSQRVELWSSSRHPLLHMHGTRESYTRVFSSETQHRNNYCKTYVTVQYANTVARSAMQTQPFCIIVWKHVFA